MMKPQIQPALSASDSKILHAVFDPESAPEAPRVTVDPSLPSDPRITDSELLSDLRAREVAAVKVVEGYLGSDDRRKHDAYLEALGMLDAIIKEYPMYASAWNNRAQVRRWRFGDRGVLTRKCATTPSGQVSEARKTIIQALSDLDQAIALASPSQHSSKDSAISPSQGKLLAQAWTQRAAVFWGAAKDLGTPSTSLIPARGGDDGGGGVPEWSTWDKTRFEEEGSRCFFMAGLYGSEMGRAMAVLSNPTAKLCGSIVKEAMRRERGEHV